MNIEQFMTKKNRCIQIVNIIDSYQHESDKEALILEFKTNFKECFDFGKKILERDDLTSKAREKMSEFMGELNNVFPFYKSVVQFLTKNAIDSSRSKEDDMGPKR